MYKISITDIQLQTQRRITQDSRYTFFFFFSFENWLKATIFWDIYFYMS